MTVGTRVTMSLQGPDESRGYDTKCPLMGVVESQDSGPPAIATILWESGGPESQDIEQANLRQVLSNDQQEGILVGKYLQINGLVQNGDFGLPKSPAASGLCIQAFQLATDFAGGTTPTAFAVIAIDDGNACMLVPVGLVSTLSDPATIEELEASGVIRVLEGPRDLNSA